MARRSCPLECFERCDTVLDGLSDWTDVSSRHPDSWGPAKLDLFSEPQFTKHCKWAVAGFHFEARGRPDS